VAPLSSHSQPSQFDPALPNQALEPTANSVVDLGNIVSRRLTWDVGRYVFPFVVLTVCISIHGYV
jgi:hypothetical protein